LADAANAFMGLSAPRIIVAGALVSILGNLNVEEFLARSRILYAYGCKESIAVQHWHTHETFPHALGRDRYQWMIILILTIQASFLTAVAFATITRLLGICNHLRWHSSVFARAETFRLHVLAPFGIAASVLSLALIAWLLTERRFREREVYRSYCGTCRPCALSDVRSLEIGNTTQ
jgi:hypothetical protein